jgi:transcription antitermination factor NusG
MAYRWYVLRSKPRKEDVVWQQLQTRGIENYYPRIRVHPVNPRARKIKPYFPGYLFINVDLDDLGISVFKWMPHTLGFVSFDGEPATVPEFVVKDLKKRIQEINDAGGEIYDGLERGDKVRIHDGPFSGYEAVFDARLPGQERVRVLLQLISDLRQIPVELKTSQIRKVTKR